MPLFKIEDFNPNYRKEAFDGGDVKGLDVHAGRTEEKIGSIYDVLVDQTGRFRYFVIDTGFWVFGKKVLLPVGRCRVDPDAQRLYATGIATKEQAEKLPEYHDSMTVDYDYEERVRHVHEVLDEVRHPIREARHHEVDVPPGLPPVGDAEGLGPGPRGVGAAHEEEDEPVLLHRGETLEPTQLAGLRLEALARAGVRVQQFTALRGAQRRHLHHRAGRVIDPAVVRAAEAPAEHGPARQPRVAVQAPVAQRGGTAGLVAKEDHARAEESACQGLSGLQLRGEAGHVPVVLQRATALEVGFRLQVHVGRGAGVQGGQVQGLSHAAAPEKWADQPGWRCRSMGLMSPARWPSEMQRDS